jgi:hypothetical protein
MEQQQTRTQQTYLAIVSILGWFALIAQFYINVTSKAASVPEIITRYFSYFTIDTNLLVTLCCTTILLRPKSGWGNFFSQQATLTAMAVYIVMVGIVYNIILRFIWNPKGLQQLVDELLHAIIPILFLLYWLIFAPKYRLKWKDALPWMIYPFVYGILILIRGTLSGFYPYPFFEIDKLGVVKVLLNTAGLTVAFYFLALLFIGIGKLMSSENDKIKIQPDG